MRKNLEQLLCKKSVLFSDLSLSVDLYLVMHSLGASKYEWWHLTCTLPVVLGYIGFLQRYN